MPRATIAFTRRNFGVSHRAPRRPRRRPGRRRFGYPARAAVQRLYFAGFFTMITALIGVIIAYVQIDKADDMLRTHYRFQIRTFWIGLLYIVIGALSAIVIVGIIILLWWFIWTLVRCVKGLLALNENRPIQNPGSWLFG